MEKARCIVGIGELLWDVFPEEKRLGGAPVNFCYHTSRYGLPSVAVSAVGEDEAGRQAKKLLSDKGVEFELPAVPYPTGTVSVTVDERGVPGYRFAEDTAWDHLSLNDRIVNLLERCRAVCFGTLAQRSEASRRTIRDALDYVPASALRVFDINLRQDYFSEEVITESLRRCDLLKINEEELSVLTEMFGLAGEEESACRSLMGEFGISAAILTLGTEGSRVFAGSETSYLPTPAVRVVDTVGAGDAFTAGFVAMTLKGHPLREAHREAVRLSAFVCTQKGAMPEVPGR